MEEEVKSVETKNKKNILIPIIIITVVVILAVVILFIIKPFGNNDNGDNGDDNETVKLDEKITVNTYKTENLFYVSKVLQSGETFDIYAYDCKNDSCQIITDDKGIVLFDENKIRYRAYTSEEVIKINNTNELITPEILDMKGFKDIKEYANLKKSEIENLDADLSIYMIEGKVYIKKNDNVSKDGITIDDMLFYDNIIYNLDKEDVVYSREKGQTASVTKEGNLYLVKVIDDNTNNLEDEIFNKKIELLTKKTTDKYYIKDNNVYYIDADKVMQVNEKNKIKEYDASITALALNGDTILYLDKENQIMMKKINEDKPFFTSNLKMKNSDSYVYLEMFDDAYQIIYNDQNVLNEADFDKYLKENIKDNEIIQKIKKCGLRNNDCDWYIPVLGYMLKVDKKGKLISKEYIFLG